MVKHHWDTAAKEHFAFTHQHSFTAGETDSARDQWLQECLSNAEAKNTKLFWRKTPDGYEFGFDDFQHYAQFYLDAFGDAPSQRGHKCTHVFSDGMNPYWVKAAEMYLKASGISYQMNVTGNEVTFAFDRFSESAALRMMIEGKEIDRTARILHGTDAFLGRIAAPGANPGHLLFNPKIALEQG